MPIKTLYDPVTKQPVRRVAYCQQCAVAMINGILCHERGCPDAWRDELRECKECGREFVPETKHQRHCDADCARAGDNAEQYHNG